MHATWAVHFTQIVLEIDLVMRAKVYAPEGNDRQKLRSSVRYGDCAVCELTAKFDMLSAALQQRATTSMQLV
jgi:hypothetical protein